MKVGDLLKKATKLKKENKVEEAIQVLDEAYKKGIYEPPSHQMEEDEGYTDFDKLLTLQDLVRKAKYLQEIGKIDASLTYLDDLIKNTSSRANYSVWEIDELSNVHNHKAIVLKKEKRFNEEFIERVKSYCLRGISLNIKTNKKPEKTGDDFIDEFNLKNFNRNKKTFSSELKNLLDPIRLLKFVEDNSKKTQIGFDKKEVVGFIQLVINNHYKTDKISIELKKLIK
jgi:tetratricopeptide (TPR) repeat protein